MNRYRCHRAILVALAALALLGLPAPSGARAAGEGAKIGLRPVRYDPARPATQSYFIYDPAPGETVQDEVLVRNSGDATTTVRLYAVDGATGQTSGAVYLAGDAPRRDVGRWATLDGDELTLGPGEERVVPFAVAVPADAPPGQHLGGLVAEDTTLTPSASDGPLRLTVQRRAVVAVQVNLPGARAERLTIGGVTPGGERGQQALLLDLRNDGSELVKAAGTLTVTDAGGQEVQRLALTLDTLVPRTAIAYPVYVERQALGPGRYHAAVHLTYGERGVTDYQGDFTIAAAQVAQVFGGRQAPAPPPAAPGAASWITARRAAPLVALALLLLAALAGFARQRRRHRPA